MTELVVVPKPQAPGHLESHHAGLECGLILARPNTILIERQLMIDSEWTAGIGRLRKQRHGCRGDEFREWTIQVCHAYPILLCTTKYTELPSARKYLQLVRRCLPILETRFIAPVRSLASLLRKFTLEK